MTKHFIALFYIALLWSMCEQRLVCAETFFTKLGVLAPPQRNQIWCDYLNAGAAPIEDKIFVLHRADFERFGRDETLLVGTLNQTDGTLHRRLGGADFRPPNSHPNAQTEDPRVFWYRNKLWALYNSTETGGRWDPRFFCLADLEVDAEQGRLRVESVRRLHYPRARRMEKNWAPLVDGNELYIIYSLFPCRVLRVDFDEYRQKDLAVSDLFLSGRSYSPNGNFFSNSTNFIPVCLEGRQYFLGMYHFFHQAHPRYFLSPSDSRPIYRQYFTGFVLLEGEPPFSVACCTPPILDSLFDAHSRSRVIFPSSIWIQGDQLLCAAGFADRESWLLAAPLERILQRCLEWPLLYGQPQWTWGKPWPGGVGWGVEPQPPNLPEAGGVEGWVWCNLN